jgi:hypothetical protein
MANVYQQGYSYVVDTGTPETGSFVINSSTWTSATTISLHNIPFDSYGSGSGGVQITGSSDVDFSEYYGSLGVGSVIFATYSGSSYSWNVTNVTENTGYFTFTVTNLTGPGGGVEPGASPVNFYVQPAGANATIANNANNRITTATGTAGELNAEANLTFDGTLLDVDGNLTVSGSVILGDAAGDTVIITGRLQAASIGTGTDNSVLIQDSSGNIKTDEIDGKVWGGRLVDNTGTPADSQVAIWVDSDTIEGDSAVTWDGAEFRIEGNLSANEKNFDIKHPSKEGWRLRYSSLEGPERGVYVRGKLYDNNCIELPDYWKDLVIEDSMTVHLTSYRTSMPHWIEDIQFEENKIYVGSEQRIVSVHYVVYGERKTDEPLVIEYKAKE